MAALFITLRMAGPVAVPVQTSHDFGEFWAGEVVSHTFVIKNAGGFPLELLRVGDHVYPDPRPPFDRKIAPGAEGRFPVVLDTKRFKGPFTKGITLSTTDPLNSTILFKLSGTSTPRVAVDPPSAAFSQIRADDVLSKLITITNNTDRWMELSLENSESGPFTASLNEIIPGKRFELLVEGSPPYETGLNRGTITLTHNIIDQPRIEVVPERVALDAAPWEDSAITLAVINHGPGEVCVTSATPDDPRITATVTERTPGRAYDIALLAPAGYVPPMEGASLTISTTDVNTRTLRVPIVQVVGR